MTANNKRRVARGLQIGVHLGALSAFLWLFYALPAGKLGGDPVPELIHYLGLGALRLLMLCLLITPLAKWTKNSQLMRLRRPLGLWAFTWMSLHFSAWLLFDLELLWGLIGEEIVKRTYILIGFSIWLAMLSLAVTSVPKIMRKMGRNWVILHRLIYPALLLACVHFWWSQKSGWIEPASYLLLCIAILALRPDKLRRIFIKPKPALASSR